MVGGTFHWVVALADGGLSTPVVYAELGRLRRGRRVPRPAVGHDILTAVRTDTRDGLGALAAMVSGSGPSCVLLARDDEHAAGVADALAATAVCAAVQVAIGPTPSAPHHRRAARSIVDAG